VRQASAITLLLLFGIALISPMLSADPESKLPACCRRDGKHHCAMMDMLDAQESSGGPTAKSVPGKCPYYPKASAAPAYSKTVILKASEAIFTSLISLPAVHTQTEALYRVSYSRTRQKRGPPIHS
jgi:hypothetical protein